MDSGTMPLLMAGLAWALAVWLVNVPAWFWVRWLHRNGEDRLRSQGATDTDRELDTRTETVPLVKELTEGLGRERRVN